MKTILEHAISLLEKGQPVVLAQIVRQVGSAPRSLGSRCLIHRDGSIFGTIGGGLLEYKVQQRAVELFEEGKSEIYPFHMTSEDVAKSDMCCGGIVDIYIEPMSPDNQDNLALLKQTLELINNNEKGTLLSFLANGRGSDCTERRMLVAADGTVMGHIPQCRDRAMDWAATNKARLFVGSEPDQLVFADPINTASELILCGAGHVANCVAPLAKMAGFCVVVVDDREEFSNLERYPSADNVQVLPFDSMFDHIAVTDKSYIAILTRGHAHDRTVLKAALSTDAAYIGMVSSSRKRELLFKSLEDEGFGRSQLEQIRTPIGLDIAAETPEEIAISIVAEMIKVRAEKEGGRFFKK
jgi:xanthine dehydrogenase accessory factor